MTDPRDERHEERELADLFEATAEQASQPELTKLRARAAGIPARARRRRWFWVVAPALAGALAASAFLMQRRALHPEPTLPVAQTPQAAVPKLTSEASSSGAPSTEPADELALDDVDALNDLDDGLGVDLALTATAPDTDVTAEGDGFEALYEPPPGADLDAWLRATDDLLQGGG